MYVEHRIFAETKLGVNSPSPAPISTDTPSPSINAPEKAPEAPAPPVKTNHSCSVAAYSVMFAIVYGLLWITH